VRAAAKAGASPRPRTAARQAPRARAAREASRRRVQGATRHLAAARTGDGDGGMACGIGERRGGCGRGVGEDRGRTPRRAPAASRRAGRRREPRRRRQPPRDDRTRKACAPVWYGAVRMVPQLFPKGAKALGRKELLLRDVRTGGCLAQKLYRLDLRGVCFKRYV
jgi:hypothetical protein